MDDFVLGDRELDVMGVLWDLGSGTVTEVRDKLPADLAYTTVLTILRNLEAKEFLYHTSEGKAHRYFPRVARQTARRSAIAKIVDKLFHGSPEQLVAQLVEDEHLSAEDLRRLRALLAAPPKPGGQEGRKVAMIASWMLYAALISILLSLSPASPPSVRCRRAGRPTRFVWVADSRALAGMAARANAGAPHSECAASPCTCCRSRLSFRRQARSRLTRCRRCSARRLIDRGRSSDCGSRSLCCCCGRLVDRRRFARAVARHMEARTGERRARPALGQCRPRGRWPSVDGCRATGVDSLARRIAACARADATKKSIARPAIHICSLARRSPWRSCRGTQRSGFRRVDSAWRSRWIATHACFACIRRPNATAC